MKIKFALLAMTIFTSSVVHADSQALAGSIFDKTVALQMEPLIDRLLMAGGREKALPPEVQSIYRKHILGFMMSPKYRQAYISAYTATFTEKELETLNDLASHPGFALYLGKSAKITEMTYPTFAQLLQESKPAVAKELEAAGYNVRK